MKAWRVLDVRKRIVLSLLIALLSAGYTYTQLKWRDCLACDFTVSWLAARHLLNGENPYQLIQPIGEFPFNASFYYPLPAALVAIPFAWLPPALAGAAFFGLGAGLLVFAVTKNGWQPLLLFLTPPFFVAGALAQWSPLLMAAALLPWLQWLAPVKPNLGLGALIYRPTWAGWIGSAVLGGVSLLVLPSWPVDWLKSVQTNAQHRAPFLVLPYAVILLLALLRWRKPEGRLLAALSLVPQTIWFYDQLMLFLIPTRLGTRLFLVGMSWLAYGTWYAVSGGEPAIRPDRYVVGLLYLPALLVVMRPEKNPLPAPASN